MAHQQAASAVAEPAHRFVVVEGLKLHHLDWGGDSKKRTFVLLHGGSAHAYWWDRVAPQLVPYGHVVALDFRGHGRSEWARPPHYGPQAYVGDVRGLIEHLGARVVLVGHSMGGAVAQWVAVSHPEVLEALIVVDSPHGPPPLRRQLMWRWRRRAQGGPRPELKTAEGVMRRFRLSPPETYLSRADLERLAMLSATQLPNGHWAFRVDPETRAWRKIEDGSMQRPKIGTIKLPTLILRGKSSGLVSASSARRMHRMIRGSVYREIPRAYHHVPLDNPDDTVNAIIEFIDSL